VKNHGSATGKLGGYGDQWFNQNLGEQDAARKLGVGNLFANETKSLIDPEQDLAAAAAYKTPSTWGDAGGRQHAGQLLRQRRQPPKRGQRAGAVLSGQQRWRHRRPRLGIVLAP
jgi:hypothetical protein